MLPDLFETGIGPSLEPRLVCQPLLDDDVPHGEGDRAVRTRARHEELVRAACSVRHADVEGDELGTVLEATLLQALRTCDMPLVGFKHIGTEVDDVLRVGVVAQVPV